VEIGGTTFTGATQVLFGSTPASSFTIQSDRTIVATAPAQNGGTFDVPSRHSDAPAARRPSRHSDAPAARRPSRHRGAARR
jgi:hypothetical protein